MYEPTAEGVWVSSEFIRLQEIIRDTYHGVLDLFYTPPEMRVSQEEDDFPYVIVDMTKNYPVMRINDRANIEEVLYQLFLGDTTKHNVLEEMDARNAARKLVQLKREQDEARARVDLVKFMVSDKRKNYIDFETTEGDIVKLDEKNRRVSSKRSFIQ